MTTPDDAFYIFKVALSRLLSTGTPRVVQWMATVLHSVIKNNYVDTTQCKMENVYRNPGVGQGEKLNMRVVPLSLCVVILLRHPLSRTDQCRYCWNNLDVFTLHMERLAKDLLFSPVIP